MLNINELKEFYRKIIEYSSPEELFENEDEKDLEALKKKINKEKKDLLKKFHPDFYERIGNQERYYASLISAEINNFYTTAIKKINEGIYGVPDEELSHSSSEAFIIKTAKNEYRITKPLIETDFSTCYQGEYKDENNHLKRVFVKICKDTDDNIFYRNEKKILNNLHHKSLASYLDCFLTSEGQEAIILKHCNGFDLYELKERFPDGLADIHVFWILERLLSAIGHVHFNVIVHGNIEPGNIIVSPKNHNVFLIDYKTATQNPTAHDYYSIATDGYSAPEVFRKSQPSPHSDIYSIGKCMIFLLGGDVESNFIPSSVNRYLSGFIKKMVEENLSNRPYDAWKLCRQFSDLRLSLFGKRHSFVEFIVPSDSDVAVNPEDTSPNDLNDTPHKHIINMIKTKSGVFEISVGINDIMKMNFILDSGASEISISSDIASVLLRSGTIDESNILEPVEYRIADGTVVTYQRLRLPKIELEGGVVINDVVASVSNSAGAPLLLGQNVLSKLGGFRIDYVNNLLIID